VVRRILGVVVVEQLDHPAVQELSANYDPAAKVCRLFLDNTPFRLNLHVSDVGHTMLIGPTSTGMSAALTPSATSLPDAISRIPRHPPSI
jgi:hypothetical protein